jgi:hypothetical protein
MLRGFELVIAAIIMAAFIFILVAIQVHAAGVVLALGNACMFMFIVSFTLSLIFWSLGSDVTRKRIYEAMKRREFRGFNFSIFISFCSFVISLGFLAAQSVDVLLLVSLYTLQFI